MKWKEIWTSIACKAPFNHENHAQNNLHSENSTFIPFKRNEEAQKTKSMIGLLYFFKMELYFLLTLPFRPKCYKIKT